MINLTIEWGFRFNSGVACWQTGGRLGRLSIPLERFTLESRCKPLALHCVDPVSDFLPVFLLSIILYFTFVCLEPTIKTHTKQGAKDEGKSFLTSIIFLISLDSSLHTDSFQRLQFADLMVVVTHSRKLFFPTLCCLHFGNNFGVHTIDLPASR